MKTTKTGCWIFREEEKSYKQFTQLERSEKTKYINFLLTLDEDILGTNDLYILNQYAPEKIQKEKSSKFLEL